MTRRRADLTLLLATAMWGTSFVAVKSGLAYATPLAFLAVRFGIAALLLAPGTRFTPLPRGRELAGGLLLGALVAVGFVSVTFGLLVTTPARSAFIVAISSVLAPLIAFVVLGQRPGWLAAAALAGARPPDRLRGAGPAPRLARRRRARLGRRRHVLPHRPGRGRAEPRRPPHPHLRPLLRRADRGRQRAVPSQRRAPARVDADRGHGPRRGGRCGAVRAAADRLDAHLRCGARLDGCLRQHAVVRAAGGSAASHVDGARGVDFLLRTVVCGGGLVARRGRATLAHAMGGRGADRGRNGACGPAVEDVGGDGPR